MEKKRVCSPNHDYIYNFTLAIESPSSTLVLGLCLTNHSSSPHNALDSPSGTNRMKQYHVPPLSLVGSAIKLGVAHERNQLVYYTIKGLQMMSTPK